MTVAVYPFVWGMAAGEGKEHTVLHVFIAQYFYIVSSTDLVISIIHTADRVSAIPEKKLFYFITSWDWTVRFS